MSGRIAIPDSSPITNPDANSARRMFGIAIGDDILCESRGRSTSRACCWRLHSAEHHEVQGHDAVPRQNSREAMTR